MCEIVSIRWRWIFLILIMLPFWMAADRDFQSEVQPLKWATKRDKTSLIALDKLGEEMLNRYHEPRQQGEIYYYLAHQHAQGGLVFPQKVIDYASRALEYPVTPDQKMRLYVYRGDAFQVLDRKKPFTESRRSAVVSYLQGLKDLRRFQLPDRRPNLPESPPFVLGLTSEKEQREQQEAQRKYREAHDRAEFTRTMMMHREVMQKQIVSLYGRRPIASEELREMGTNILGEGKELDRLMTAVNDKVAKLPPEEKQTMTPIEAAIPEAWPKYLYLSIALGVGAVIAIVLFLLSRWGRARRATGSKTAQ